MTALIIIVFILLFPLCWYIESTYQYINKGAMRKISDLPIPLRYKIEAIAIGFLLTVGMWVGIFILILTPIGFMGLFSDNNTLLYNQYEALWWTLTVIFEISILWFFYLHRLIKRSKRIKSTSHDKQLFPQIENNFQSSIISISWILCLIIVPYTAMELSYEFAQRDELYKTILAGVISATAMLGLLIIYRTRKPDENQ